MIISLVNIEKELSPKFPVSDKFSKYPRVFLGLITIVSKLINEGRISFKIFNHFLQFDRILYQISLNPSSTKN
jgi:hypothetical protein